MAFYRQQHDRRRLEWVVGGQHDSPVVDAALEVRLERAPNHEVPVEHIFLRTQWPDTEMHRKGG